MKIGNVRSTSLTHVQQQVRNNSQYSRSTNFSYFLKCTTKTQNLTGSIGFSKKTWKHTPLTKLKDSKFFMLASFIWSAVESSPSPSVSSESDPRSFSSSSSTNYNKDSRHKPFQQPKLHAKKRAYRHTSIIDETIQIKRKLKLTVRLGKLLWTAWRTN